MTAYSTTDAADAGGAVAPTSRLGLTLIRSDGGRERIMEPTAWPAPPAMTGSIIRQYGLPQRGLPDWVNRWRAGNAPRLLREGWKLAVARRLGITHVHGALWLTLDRDGERFDLGLGSLRLVTDVGVGYIVDAFQNLTELENMKFHGYGTGTTAESAAQTALVTELTTQYVSDIRPTGSTTEAAANIYRTVGTLSPDSGGTIAVAEHGIFSATSAGTLLDRSVFSAVNVVASADSLQTTYDLTIASGG
jgi:hypothetical protein